MADSSDGFRGQLECSSACLLYPGGWRGSAFSLTQLACMAELGGPPYRSLSAKLSSVLRGCFGLLLLAQSSTMAARTIRTAAIEPTTIPAIAPPESAGGWLAGTGVAVAVALVVAGRTVVFADELVSRAKPSIGWAYA